MLDSSNALPFRVQRYSCSTFHFLCSLLGNSSTLPFMCPQLLSSYLKPTIPMSSLQPVHFSYDELLVPQN